MLSDVGGRFGGVSEYSELSIFISFIKENWISAMTRHHAETSNLPLDSDVDSEIIL